MQTCTFPHIRIPGYVMTFMKNSFKKIIKADDKTKVGPENSIQINVNEDYEIA